MDGTEWPYLKKVLRKFGTGPYFMKWIDITYKEDQAAIAVVDRYRTGQGGRQGSPLSPLNFDLGLEALAIAIQ